MAIIPDALNLTSGGDSGTGAAGSVKGAKILLSTKTASRVIADVYAVRSDYLEGQPRRGREVGPRPAEGAGGFQPSSWLRSRAAGPSSRG